MGRYPVHPVPCLTVWKKDTFYTDYSTFLLRPGLIISVFETSSPVTHTVGATRAKRLTQGHDQLEHLEDLKPGYLRW